MRVLVPRVTVLAAIAAAALACSRSKAPSGDDSTGVLQPTPGLARTDAAHAGEVAGHDLPEIKWRDTLTVLMPYNSTTYFLYKGEPMGYEYELLKAFAQAHHVVLKVVAIQKRDSLMRFLLAGRGDLVAARLIPMEEDTGRVAFTRPLYHTEPVLVQRGAPPAVAERALPKSVDTALKAGPAEPPTPTINVRARLVQRPSELAGQRVTVQKKAPYVPTLIELADSLTGDLQVVEVDSSAEALIRGVARGAIQYTVAEGNVAELQGSVYKNLVIRPVIGASKPVAWAVRREARQLRDSLNRWIGDEKTRGVLDRLYKKYFIDARGFQTRLESRYLTSTTGTLSPYDELLRRYAPQIGWDWRLLGSQAYQESRFNPRARSWAGATGLLQLMPSTARSLGVRVLTDPEQNVRGAVKYLQDLERHWAKNVADSTERLKFVLASFNAGTGHVEDAQRLAEKHGDDPLKWAQVSYWLLQLSKTEYYDDPVVKYGFCRGMEPVAYVTVILDRFDHYRQFVTTA
ncbi:ABC-type transporter, periplasmic subunit family 3 [Gemmatirosa kalamazoonensis]|uniref:ABC-type transporter, periplasmic subunit family 3 n=1 Tax=Gemmatirosa kalamazoonensis TaxID=861299 RepID=W0RD94_9BACT|nr:transporter substrate-binding domain-containing protein [Gemmatirosa kalamazoonensis]AHG88280.1 ABC-type transporter, periplasmic subunit family 3 [Gemmatirosa kalamazoonensis]